MIIQATRMFLVLSIICGVLYPAAIQIIAELAFKNEAHGSMVTANGKIVGSKLIGQNFTSDRYFWGRPSATGPYPYNGAASSGSNLSQTNPLLLKQIMERQEKFAGHSPESTVPQDLLTSSGSGLDPHISPEAARFQIARVARARGIKLEELRSLVEKSIEMPTIGLLGEARVNVLLLNLELDLIHSSL